MSTRYAKKHLDLAIESAEKAMDHAEHLFLLLDNKEDRKRVHEFVIVKLAGILDELDTIEI